MINTWSLAGLLCIVIGWALVIAHMLLPEPDIPMTSGVLIASQFLGVALSAVGVVTSWL